MSNSYKSLVSQLTARAAMSVGAGNDLAKCFKPTIPVYYFAESTCTGVYGSLVDWAQVFAGSNPQKQVFRTVQFINALNTGNISDFDKTYYRALVSLDAAGKFDLNRDAVFALASNTRNVNANTRGIALSVINASGIKAHGTNTVGTKLSGSLGAKNGVYQQLGLTYTPPERNAVTALNTDHLMVKRFFEIVRNATQGQRDAMTA